MAKIVVYLGLDWIIEVDDQDALITSKFLEASFRTKYGSLLSNADITSISFEDENYDNLVVEFRDKKVIDMYAFPIDIYKHNHGYELAWLNDKPHICSTVASTPVEQINILNELFETARKLQRTRIEAYVYKLKVEKELLKLRNILESVVDGIQNA